MRRPLLPLLLGALLLFTTTGCGLLQPVRSDICNAIDTVACAGPPPTAAWPRSQQFAATAWLDSVSAPDSHPFVPGRPVTVTFGELGEVEVGTGCNTLAVHGRFDGLHLWADQLVSSGLPCPTSFSEQEQWLTDFFDNDPECAFTTTQVTLRTVEAAIIFDAVTPSA